METSVKATKTDKRMAGVLMPVSALPSHDGIGTFGKNAYKFVDIIADMGMSIWQILPLNPLGYGNSPYQPFSSYAGDELYIDLDILARKGYISRERISYINKNRNMVDYDDAREYKTPFLKKAFISFKQDKDAKEGFEEFCKKEWVKPYAVFITLKKANDMMCWNEWPKEQQNWILDNEFDITEYEDDIEYAMFLQYMFYVQWNDLKAYANSKGILIMGDVPFYVGIDSLDVWQSREDFLLDTDGRPIFIAGVPPDYFSVTGQRWGNPIYDWDHLKENDFEFWMKRLSYSGELYDIIRVDHFRAFDTFWKIPATCETAVEGEWIEAPGYELLGMVNEKLPNLWIIAEDLGDLRPEVLTLRDHFGLMGMYIAEFSVLSDTPAVENQLIYTGTHDNQTVKGWYMELDNDTRKQVDTKLKRYGKPGDSVNNRVLHFVFESDARLAIVPISDILEYDDSARLNSPGTVGSPNWEWKLDSLSELRERIDWIRGMVSKTGRLKG